MEAAASRPKHAAPTSRGVMPLISYLVSPRLPARGPPRDHPVARQPPSARLRHVRLLPGELVNASSHRRRLLLQARSLRAHRCVIGERLSASTVRAAVVVGVVHQRVEPRRCNLGPGCRSDWSTHALQSAPPRSADCAAASTTSPSAACRRNPRASAIWGRRPAGVSGVRAQCRQAAAPRRRELEPDAEIPLGNLRGSSCADAPRGGIACARMPAESTRDAVVREPSHGCRAPRTPRAHRADAICSRRGCLRHAVCRLMIWKCAGPGIPCGVLVFRFRKISRTASARDAPGPPPRRPLPRISAIRSYCIRGSARDSSSLLSSRSC